MTTKNDRVREYEFVLVLAGITDLSPENLDALFEAGCDDSTPSARAGRVYLAFDREAPSLKEAILSAIRDVKRAEIGADVQLIDACNLVSQADIARRIRRTRQQVRQYVSGERGPGRFPAPTCHLLDGHPLWQWCEVAHWLCQYGIVGEDVLADARVIAAINSVLEYRHRRRHDAALVEEILQVVEEPLASHPV